MHRRLWALQIVVGLFFIFLGILHFVVPEGLPSQLEWMYDLSTPVHYVTGVAEIMGGLGLILPGLTKIGTRLTPLAALGLMVLMTGAIIWHIRRGELFNVGTNLAVIMILSFIAYERWRIHPLQ
ncbi:MAG TPA: DoxX family protein [Acidimicrobiia bacterium]